MTRILMLLFILPSMLYAAEPLFDANDLARMGTVVGSYQPAQDFLSSVTAWKSVRVQATASGIATHFLVKILSTTNITTVPIGVAVYAGTSGYDDPIGPLLARAYYASYRFGSGAGWYAIPFTNPETFEVTLGNYYHLAFLINPEATALNFARANNAAPYPPKWNSNCSGAACSETAPPGTGSEYWNFQYDNNSAPWVMGLLSAGGSGNGPQPPIELRIVR